MGARKTVIGIGHALVDLEYTVSEKTLQEIGLRLEDTVLATDKEQQKRLMLLKEKYGAPAHIAPGGSCANTVVTASFLGSDAHFICKTADDVYGNQYTSSLQKSGISVHNSNATKAVHAQTDNQAPTGTALVLLTSDGNRSMSTYLGMSASFSANDLDYEAIQSAEWLFCEGYFASSEQSVDAVKEAKKHAANTMISLSSVGMVEFFRDGLESMLEGGVAALIGNDQEAQAFTGISDPVEAAKALNQYAQVAVVTCGADGAVASVSGEVFSAKGLEVAVIDPLGSGDAFAGAYLAGLTLNVEHDKLLTFACGVGACSVQHEGPRLSEHALAAYKEVLSSL